MINFLKWLFWVPKLVLDPARKPIAKEVLFQNTVIARERYNFIYNHMLEYMATYDNERAKSIQELLVKIKILSDNHGSKIKFQ